VIDVHIKVKSVPDWHAPCCARRPCDVCTRQSRIDNDP
jgi:hypothetical protein